MGLAGPHDMGTEFIRQVLNESQTVWPDDPLLWQWDAIVTTMYGDWDTHFHHSWVSGVRCQTIFEPPAPPAYTSRSVDAHWSSCIHVCTGGCTCV